MYKGQKSIRGGIEDFLCPFTDFYLTCGPNESKYHMGIMAIDVRGAESGIRYAYYAPATSKCIRTYPVSGQVMWQTVNPVRCSNGYVGIVTYMTVHDDTMDAYPGLVVPQGNQLGNMGTKGNDRHFSLILFRSRCSFLSPSVCRIGTANRDKGVSHAYLGIQAKGYFFL